MDATGMIGESSAVLRCLPTPSTAEPRSLARGVSRRHARLLGDEPGWCVGHVYGSGMVRCAVLLPWATG